MKNQLTSRDYELVSAYLDNQLGRKERALFEARLKTDSELRKELHEISKTRLLLRQLPRLRAPHNYFIKAEAIHARSSLRLAPVFGIASAIASVLLALVIFGSTIFASSPQVALAPLAPSNAPLAVQPEVGRSATSPVTATEAGPVGLMGAQVLGTPTSNTSALEITQTEIATPTTIFLYAYPPSSTPISGISINNQETEVARTICQEFYGGGTYPTMSGSNNCPTPTGTLSIHLESILSTSTPSPSATLTPLPSATPTPNTNIPLIASPTPTPTIIPPSIQKEIPTGSEITSTEVSTFDHSLVAANPTAVAQQPTETAVAPNVSFLNYILLTVEISLAAIAIIAGITAIVLRIRAR
jgi:hypothetical protein